MLITPHGIRMEALDQETVVALLKAARMIGSTRQITVWAYGAPADLRKGFEGLSHLGP